MRQTFVTTATAALRLLDDDRVSQAWHEPSVLDRMTVGGLVAHLARAVLTVQGYLAADPPAADADLVDAAGYLLTALPDTAQDSEINQQVLARAEAGGAEGAAAVRRRATEALAAVQAAVAEAPPGRRCSVLGGIAMDLDDYLATRVLELVVHVDDLTASIPDLDPSPLPEDGEAAAVALLAEVTRRRHGTTAVITTLARGERAPQPPPRAF